MWQHAVLVVAQYHAVVVVQRNLRHELLTVFFREVSFGRCKNTCCWVCLAELLCYLCAGNFQTDNHRFLGNTHTTHFHDGTLHHKGLTCTNDVVNDTTTIVDKHPHGIFLMRSQLHAHQSGDAQVRAVELAKYGAVELVIVQAH